jgi:hypothetical protein
MAKIHDMDGPTMQGCQAVFFMDGLCGPQTTSTLTEMDSQLDWHMISSLDCGQNKHEHAGGALEQVKDIQVNVDASKAWFVHQPDFNGKCTMHQNCFLLCNSKSSHPKAQKSRQNSPKASKVQ